MGGLSSRVGGLARGQRIPRIRSRLALRALGDELTDPPGVLLRPRSGRPREALLDLLPQPGQALLSFIIRFQPAQTVPDDFFGGAVRPTLDLAGDEALMTRCENDVHTAKVLPPSRWVVNPVQRFPPGSSRGPRYLFRVFSSWRPCVASSFRRRPKSSPELAAPLSLTRSVLDCGRPLPLSPRNAHRRTDRHAKAPEGRRTPKRWCVELSTDWHISAQWPIRRGTILSIR